MSLDALSFIEQAFDRVTAVTSSEGEYKVSPCPNCGSSKGKLYINVETKVFNCFRCSDYHGRIEKLMRDMGYNPYDYVIDDDMTDYFIENTPKAVLPEVKFKEQKLPLEYRLLIGNTSLLGKAALSYVRGRGIPDNIIQEFKMGFCFDGQYKNRIIVPYYEDDELVYFSARDFTDSQTPKYLNPSWERKGVLFNYERAVKDTSYVVIVEGVFDIFSLPEHAVCLLGKQVSDEQVAKLRRFKKVYIALDSDAISTTYKIAQDLNSNKQFNNVYIVNIPKGHDPSSLGTSNFMNCIRSAKYYNSSVPSSELDTFTERYLKSLW